ncbi:hypothetical protein S40288_10418 [Stachybotrys chartarum IBT 40288]|nr:hypothetical protein S40288_10418 [Stachybotrys chartarum IBT 40288]
MVMFDQPDETICYDFPRTTLYLPDATPPGPARMTWICDTLEHDFAQLVEIEASTESTQETSTEYSLSQTCDIQDEQGAPSDTTSLPASGQGASSDVSFFNPSMTPSTFATLVSVTNTATRSTDIPTGSDGLLSTFPATETMPDIPDSATVISEPTTGYGDSPPAASITGVSSGAGTGTEPTAGYGADSPSAASPSGVSSIPGTDAEPTAGYGADSPSAASPSGTYAGPSGDAQGYPTMSISAIASSGTQDPMSQVDGSNGHGPGSPCTCQPS